MKKNLKWSEALVDITGWLVAGWIVMSIANCMGGK